MQKKNPLFSIFFFGMMTLSASGCGVLRPSPELDNTQVAVLTTEGFHDAETVKPMEYLESLGSEVTVIGPQTGEITAYNSKVTVEIEKRIKNVEPEDFDALVIPGGNAPKKIAENEEAVNFTRRFVESGRITAAICHGPLLLAAADVLTDRKVTAYHRIKEDLIEAGADFQARTVVIPFTVRDENIITARLPWDLRTFNRTIGKALEEQTKTADVLCK